MEIWEIAALAPILGLASAIDGVNAQRNYSARYCYYSGSTKVNCILDFITDKWLMCCHMEVTSLNLDTAATSEEIFRRLATFVEVTNGGLGENWRRLAPYLPYLPCLQNMRRELALSAHLSIIKTCVSVWFECSDLIHRWILNSKDPTRY